MLVTPFCIVKVVHFSSKNRKKITKIWNFCEVLSQFLEHRMMKLNNQDPRRFVLMYLLIFSWKIQVYVLCNHVELCSFREMVYNRFDYSGYIFVRLK